MAWRRAGVPFLGGTPIVSIAQAAIPSSAVNLSNEGTIDWHWMANYTTSPRLNGISSASHVKLGGPGYFFNSLEYIAQSQTVTAQAMGTAGFSSTSTASDDASGVALGNANELIITTASSVLVNLGFRFKVPAWQNVVTFCRVYAHCWSCAGTLTATLTKSGTTQSVTIDSGANAVLEKLFTISFAGGDPSDELFVTWLLSTNHAASPNIGIAALTLAAA